MTKTSQRGAPLGVPALLVAIVATFLAGGQAAYAQPADQPTQPRLLGEDEEPEFEVHRTLVAGSTRMLYVVQVDETRGEFTLRMAAPDELGEVRQAWRARGEVVGLAVEGVTAYLIYSDHSVQSMRWVDREPVPPRPFERRQLPPLPGDGQVLDVISTGPRQMAVLMGPEGWQGLAGGEAASVSWPRPNEQGAEPQSEPGEGDAEAGAESAGASAEADSGTGEAADVPGDEPQLTDQAVEGLRLFRLSRNRWQEVPLPEDVEPESVIGLGHGRPGQVILLSAHQTAEGEGAVRQHAWNPDPQAWREDVFAVEPSPWVRRVVPGAGEPVLVRGESAAGPIDVYLARSGSAVTHLGRLDAIDDAATWWATPVGKRLTLVFSNEQHNLGQWSWDLRGEFPAAQAPQPMEPAEMPRPGLEPVMWLVAVALALALLILLMTMGSVESNVPRLPPSLRPAGMLRVWAGLIDFVPALGVSMLIFQIADPLEVLRHWPMMSQEWESMVPAAVAIGLHALHTLLAELVTGRSLGKWITGCRVVNLQGEPVTLGQMAGRNLLKILEMAVPWLLLLPVLPALLPHQQRLGDLIARTLVVVDVPVEEQPPQETEKAGDQPESERENDPREQRDDARS